jgi:hypothetical protein
MDGIIGMNKNIWIKRTKRMRAEEKGDKSIERVQN